MRKLRAWRLCRFLTQQGLADRVGVPVSSIQRWEAGTRQPRPGSLGRICTALAIDLDQLLASDELAAAGRAQPRTPREQSSATTTPPPPPVAPDPREAMAAMNARPRFVIAPRSSDAAPR